MDVPSTWTAPTPAEPKNSSVIVTVVQVLRCFTVDEPLQGVTEIAQQVGLHKSSVSRTLAALEKERIVERDTHSRKYRLGLGLLSVAGPLLANLDVRRAALPVLRELAVRSGETSALVVWSGGGSVTVEEVPSPQRIKHTTPLGTRYESVENASVQVFLAELPHDEVRARMVGGGPDATGRPPGDVDALIEELIAVSARGYAVNECRTSPDVVGVASPVRDYRGEVVAAVLVAAPSYRTPSAEVSTLGQQTQHAASEVSRRLGAT